MSIGVLIATYGDNTWRDLALTRARPSAERENPDQIVTTHQPAGTIATSRNAAAELATTEWLLFLDGDDELVPGFVWAMRRSIQVLQRGPDVTRCLFTPAVAKVLNGHQQRPKFYPEVPLRRANWLVIGTLIHQALFEEVGGFEEYPHGLEDFQLWAKCAKAGARVIKVPRAVYVAHWNDQSKHHVLMRDRAEHLRWYEKARRSVWGDELDLSTISGRQRARRR